MRVVKLSVAIYSILLMAGCASSGDQGTGAAPDYQAELEARQMELDARNLELSERDQEIESLKQQLSEKPVSKDASQEQMSSATMSTDSLNDSLLPPNAKAGQCFARVYTPPTYRSDSETVLKADGYDVLTIIPAVYEAENQVVMTQEATEVLEVIPAVYGWKEEQVLVSPEITELQRVPAEYGFEEETLLVKPAHSIWKKGSGPITKIDESTGEIMCLVEVPAVYETVQKRVLLKPESTKQVVVKPAVYKTVRTRVVEQPAKTVTRTIPAVYDTVEVKKLVKDADTSVSTIPAVYETVEKTIKVSDGYLEWAPILCDTNVTGDIVRQLQQALNEKGYKAGPVDGVYGWRTTNAVRSYQSDNKMAGDGQLTIALVDSLGLDY